MTELPTISNKAATSNYYSPVPIVNSGTVGAGSVDSQMAKAFAVLAKPSFEQKAAQAMMAQVISKDREEKKMPQRRIVQIFIADPDENIPMADAIIYRGEQKLTDLDNSELFFEIPIHLLLEKHNIKRAVLLDKKATNKLGKEIHLEPTRIRNLKMVVVDIAVF